MAGSQYAQVTDLAIYGLPPTALGPQLPNGGIPVSVQNAALIAASAVMDNYFRGRYPLPFSSWGIEVTEACCKIAAYQLLSGYRGFNPAAGADSNIRLRFEDTMAWLNKVQRQAAHPDVTPQVNANQNPTYQQPNVQSSSVVFTATGTRAPQRGW